MEEAMWLGANPICGLLYFGKSTIYNTCIFSKKRNSLLVKHLWLARILLVFFEKVGYSNTTQKTKLGLLAAAVTKIKGSCRLF